MTEKMNKKMYLQLPSMRIIISLRSKNRHETRHSANDFIRSVIENKTCLINACICARLRILALTNLRDECIANCWAIRIRRGNLPNASRTH
jgi:hypothetical protein